MSHNLGIKIIYNRRIIVFEKSHRITQKYKILNVIAKGKRFLILSALGVSSLGYFKQWLAN